MKTNFTLAAIFIILAGCANSRLEFKKEPLTGKEYCVADNRLLSLKNNEAGSLLLKYVKEASAKETPIKATLNIIQSGREYNINPHETLTLSIDENLYPLGLLNSFQEPLEVPSNYSVYMPSGRTLMLGTIKEVTKRRMSFFLPLDCLSKMIAAKRVTFEISSPSRGDSIALQRYPIILELGAESLSFLQEFKNKCVTNFLSQSGAEQ